MSNLIQLLGGRAKFLEYTGGCHACPRNKRVEFVPATLPDAPFIVVGEAPGATEVEKGEGFVGKAGAEVMRPVFARHGLTEFALTNTIHCRPPDNRNPTGSEVTNCMAQFTMEEVRGYSVVVLAGAVPARAFFKGSRRFNELRGNVAWHPDFPGQRFYTIYHPAYILRRPDLADEFDRQIERLSRIVRGEDVRFNVIQGDPEETLAALARHLEADLLGYDIETVGRGSRGALRVWEDGSRMRSFALAGSDTEAVFVSESDPHWGEARSMVADRFGSGGARIVGHHVGFDVAWTEEELGFRARPAMLLDTAFLWYQAAQYQMIGLKELQAREGDGYRYLVPSPSDEIDLGLLAQYNAEDVIYPRSLARKAMRQMPRKTLDLCVRVGGPSDLTAQRITNTGVWFYADRWEKRRASIRGDMEDVLRRWQEVDPRFNPDDHLSSNRNSSGKRFERYLFEVAGLQAVSKTDKGNPQIDKESLQAWGRAGWAPADLVLEYRKLEKVRGTYVEPFEGHLAGDHRVHPSYRTTKTDTGRTASHDPNYQNQPRGPVRGFFGAPEGWRFFEFDLSQIELRIMMCLAGDPTGIAAYRAEDSDLHIETARYFADDPDKEQRTYAKAINFAECYGGTPYTIKRNARKMFGIDITDEQAEEFHHAFTRVKYPQLSAYHGRLRQELRDAQGWAESAVGHRYYYKDWNHPVDHIREHCERAYINSKGQSPATYMLRDIMIETERVCYAEGIPARFVGEVHDAIHGEVRIGAEADLVAVAEQAVARTARWVADWFVVPLVMEYEFGRLGEGEKPPNSWNNLEAWQPQAA